MQISLTYDGLTLELPSDLQWTDRDSWSPVEQVVETSITGAALIDIAARTAGRPFTLSGNESQAWMPFSTVDRLRSWAAVAGRQMTLMLDGASYPVIFRHHDKPAIDVSPVVDYSSTDNADFFFGTLKFMGL